MNTKLITLTVTPAFVKLLKSQNITLNTITGTTLTFNDGITIEEHTTLAHTSFLPHVGMYTSLAGAIPQGIASIGRFCTIGQNLTVATLPPYPVLSTSPLLNKAVTNYNTGAQPIPLTPQANHKAVTIGHDVWVGDNVTIMQGVTIGSGAIIAPNTVVAHSVEPYQVIAGNTGIVIGSRFNTQVIQKLMEAQWWQYPSYYLADNEGSDINTLLAKFENRPINPSKPLTWEYGQANTIDQTPHFTLNYDEIPMIKLTDSYLKHWLAEQRTA